MMLSWLLMVWICSTIHRSSWEHLWSMQFLAMMQMSLVKFFPEAETFLAEAMSWSLVYIKDKSVKSRKTLPAQVSPETSGTDHSAYPKLSWLNLLLHGSVLILAWIATPEPALRSFSCIGKKPDWTISLLVWRLRKARQPNSFSTKILVPRF